MKKLIRISAIVLVAAALAVATPSAFAVCGLANARALSSIGLGNCGGFCTINTDASGQGGLVQSAFWRAATGASAVGAGDDNGAYPASSWLVEFAPGQYVALGATEDGPSDGCIDPDFNTATKDTVFVAVCDPAGKFVVLAAQQDASGTFVYDQVDTAGGYNTQPTPRLTVTSTTRIAGSGATVNFTTPAASAFTQYVNGGTPVTSMPVTGVRVYQKVVARNAGFGVANVAPRPLASGGNGWTLVGTFGLNAAGSVNLTAAVDSDAYLGVEPVFDGADPFSSGCVTADPQTVQVGPTVANPSDGTPRTIRKPRGLQPNPN